MKPKISVIIPIHTDLSNLRVTIESVIAQSYDNIEIIVVDSGHKEGDATKKIAKSYGSRVNYYKNESDSIATSLNFGIKKQTGQYFSWLSPGDTYEPTRVEKLVKLVVGSDNVIAASDWVVVNRNG